MHIDQIPWTAHALAPVILMFAAAALTRINRVNTARLWRAFQWLSGCALMLAMVSLCVWPPTVPMFAALRTSLLTQTMAVLVQLLGSVIGAFSARYLEGEHDQRRYVAALATVLAAVHLLLLADHWVILIAAWALVGVALEQLLCFYPERPFARLAAYKKRLADRLADGLLVAAAALAWAEVGSGSLPALWARLAQGGMSLSLHLSAVLLVLAVVLRTALFPVHGWIIQVMEAPTPVSALLHAGVVNLGGLVLIRYAPLLEQALPARVLLLVFGLGTAVLAGMVMLTRISIKVRLAWSTVAQMGFMLLECAVGLYSLAALHLIGHSLYKAHAFLSASTVVRQTRHQALLQPATPAAASLVVAPVCSIALVLLIQRVSGHASWPWWWDAVLGIAWAPLLWLPGAPVDPSALVRRTVGGLLMVSGLTAAAMLAHALPLGIQDAPQSLLGMFALAGMAALYLCLALLQWRPRALTRWRRWSYAGFYVDEAYTRMALRLWPGRWMPDAGLSAGPAVAGSAWVAAH